MAKFFKVTNEVYENNSFEEIYEKLDEKSKELIREAIERKKFELMDCLVDCESPIEMILSIAIYETNVYMTGALLGIDVLGIDRQIDITIGKTKYRADFLITVLYGKEESRNVREFIIECDGHEFHEKTKEQVIKNNIRQRKLTNAGYVVLNFSGSEIYNEPYKCVREIKDAILSRLK
jgi:very-short-patch-repair endonuclease